MTASKTFLAMLMSGVSLIVSLPSIAAPPTGSTVPPKPAAKPAKVIKAVKTAPVMYQCPDCRDKFTEAQAKKNNLQCACCRVKLVRAAAPGVKKAKA